MSCERRGLYLGGSLYPGGGGLYPGVGAYIWGSLYPGGAYFSLGAYIPGAYIRGELYPGRLITETLSSLEATAGFSNKIGISNIFFPLPTPLRHKEAFAEERDWNKESSSKQAITVLIKIRFASSGFSLSFQTS